MKLRNVLLNQKQRARTKLATFKLEKDIEGCLAQKSHLLDRLNEIQTSKQFEHVSFFVCLLDDLSASTLIMMKVV